MSEVLKGVKTIDMRKVYAPGVYENMSNADYHASFGISKSGLDLIAKVPAKYKARYIDDIERKETPAMAAGTRLHCAILEPDEFSKRYVVNDGNRNSNAFKEFAEDAAEKGMIVIRTQEYDESMKIADSVLSLPNAGLLFSGGSMEQSFFWEDEITGEMCKCRTDYIKGEFITDLKSTEDASSYGFAKSIAKYRYYVQAPFYKDGVKRFHPHVEYFVFVAFEKEPPYLSSLHILSDDDMDYGRNIYRRDIDTYHECRKNNEWPGYSPNIEVVELPQWAYK